MNYLYTALLATCLLTPAWAQDGVTMTYQGQLADAAGAPVSASHPMTFRLYNVLAGGEALWTEIHGSVEVADGSYSGPGLHQRAGSKPKRRAGALPRRAGGRERGNGTPHQGGRRPQGPLGPSSRPRPRRAGRGHTPRQREHR